MTISVTHSAEINRQEQVQEIREVALDYLIKNDFPTLDLDNQSNTRFPLLSG